MINSKYKSSNNIVYSCRYHVVWCPKYRRKILVGDVETRLKELLNETCANMNIDIIQLEIKPDHVQLLIEVDPQTGIHKAVKNLKGITSKYLRDEFPQLRTKLPTLWTHSYLVSTVGEISMDAIQRYVESQKTSQRK